MWIYFKDANGAPGPTSADRGSFFGKKEPRSHGSIENNCRRRIFCYFRKYADGSRAARFGDAFNLYPSILPPYCFGTDKTRFVVCRCVLCKILRAPFSLIAKYDTNHPSNPAQSHCCQFLESNHLTYRLPVLVLVSDKKGKQGFP